MKLVLGDSLDKLKDLPTGTIDCVVTDPPYGLSFMGKKWDHDVPSEDLWREVFRVMKPGAHLLSFFGTRTYHAGVTRIEAAGFEVRDMLAWLYGSGFPKSLDVSKAIDKAAGAEREVVGPKTYMDGDKIRTGHLNKANSTFQSGEVANNVLTAPATADAKRWQGWGTALKPANEPIVLARKPLEKGLTVAQNVLKWGTGALNVDGTRIEAADQAALAKNWDRDQSQTMSDERPAYGRFGAIDLRERAPQGRWPANVLFDEEAAAMLDEQSGNRKSTGVYTADKVGVDKPNGQMLFTQGKRDNNYAGQEGGASRFFYVAKSSKRERNAGLEGMPEKMGPETLNASFREQSGTRGATSRANHHPTVKPIRLMEYLCKLVCPPGGIVLDPFMGSGTTGCAAVKLGLQFIGIEREAEYLEIARRRIEHWRNDVLADPDEDDGQIQLPLEPA